MAHGSAVRFRFVQLNDLHISAAPGDEHPSYPGADERAIWLIDALGAEESLGEIDFVLGLGDYVNGGSLVDLAAAIRRFHALIDPVSVPFFPVLGNCDVGPEGDEGGEFARVFGLDGVNYTFERGGIRFIVLFNGDSGAGTPPAFARRQTWLRETLEEYADSPKIICCHVPLVPLRDPAVLPRSLGIASWHCREPEILQLVNSHASSVLAVLSGHVHLSAMVCTQAVHHVSVAGTASFPSDYALFSVYDERIDVEFRQLPRHLLTEDTDLHGCARRGCDFTDDVHRTHIEYVMGTYDERRFVIPFKNPGA